MVSRHGKGEKSAEIEIAKIRKAKFLVLTPLVVKTSRFSMYILSIEPSLLLSGAFLVSFVAGQKKLDTAVSKHFPERKRGIKS